jgi:hypothetical protein
MYLAFNDADAFNQPMGNWDVGRVTSFRNMFSNTANFEDLSPSINTWHIGENTGTAGIDMLGMFSNALKFNSPLASWESDPDSTMAYVTRMYNMFRGTSIFNQPIDNWNVGRVTDFYAMFFQNKFFNRPLNNWNIGENHSANIRTDHMFGQTSEFNQPLSNWDVSQMYTFFSMFNLATAFNQSLAAWQPTNVNDFRNMLSNS